MHMGELYLENADPQLGNISKKIICLLQLSMSALKYDQSLRVYATGRIL